MLIKVIFLYDINEERFCILLDNSDNIVIIIIFINIISNDSIYYFYLINSIL